MITDGGPSNAAIRSSFVVVRLVHLLSCATLTVQQVV